MEPLRLQEHLEKLKQFETTARLGKVSMAAQSLGMSQAAVSRSIKVLEEALQVPLLVRKQSGIELTDKGKDLFVFSKKILAESITMEKSLRNLAHDKITNIKVGTHEALAIYFWPNFLKEFSRLHPKIKVSLTSGRIDALINSLVNRHYNLLLSVEPLKHIRVESKKLYSNRLCFYVSSKNNSQYPTLNKSCIKIEELNSVPLLTDIASHFRQGLTMTSYLANHGINLKNIFELNSFEASIRLAEEGLGVAVLPEAIGRQGRKLREIRVTKVTSKKFGQHSIAFSYIKQDKERFAVKIVTNELERYISKKQ